MHFSFAHLAPRNFRPNISQTNRSLALALLCFFMTSFSQFTFANDFAEDVGRDSLAAETEQIDALEEPPPRPLTAEEIREIQSFKTPRLTAQRLASILSNYSHLDPQGIVPAHLLKNAVAYFDTNADKLANRNFISVIDYSPHSMNKRFFIIDMKSGKVESYHVAHGTGSDPENTGYASLFSNTVGSNSSSLGFIRTAETYTGRNGLSLRLDGLSSTNSSMRERTVVVRGAKYVKDRSQKQGRSWGCPAVSMDKYIRVINLIKGGSLIYAAQSR